jgi:hypothetical protein
VTAINIVLGVISITGGLALIITLLAFVVASWINQPPIGKQHFAFGRYAGRSGIATCGYDEEGSLRIGG